jgi:rhodanese-related sulfurtransferase/DNA-binding transcriptional ArsR family regulator
LEVSVSLASAKRALFHAFARVAKAAASPARLQLLDLLAQGEKPVETLAAQAGLSVKNASAHLRTLREAALVTGRREGTRVYYRLADPAVYDFLRRLQAIAERQLAEVREIVRDCFAAPGGLEPLTADQLAARMRRGDVSVLDVRPRDEYAAGHIPGAVSLPLERLRRGLSRLPKDVEVVAYCRGPYCVLALEAAEWLRRRGYRVRRLAEGMPDWAGRGLPVEVGTS